MKPRHAKAWRLQRRDLLKMAASSGVLLPLLRPLQAFSDESGPPKRVVFWFQPNGVREELWFPDASVNELTDASSLSPSLAPLGNWSQRLNIVDNVELYSSYNEPLIVAPHDAGCCELWTNQACQPAQEGASFTHGGGFDSWSYPLGPSLDQFLAATRPMSLAPIRSLELGVFVRGSNTNRRMSYAASGLPVAPENDPSLAYTRLFGSRTEDSSELADIQRRAELNGRVLNRVLDDIKSLSPRLNSRDRDALDSYWSSLDVLHSEVTAPLNGALAGNCEAPNELTLPTELDSSHIPMVAQQQIRILAAALACDMTRVGSLMWMGSEATQRMSWLADDEGKTQEYHLCSHRQLPNIDGETQLRWLAETDLWFSSQLAFFLSELERLDPTGDLLDNTLIVCGNELSHGNSHARTRMPFLTIGGQWHFKTGYYRKAATPRRHGDLLVEVARAMGTDLESFGNPDYCGGPSLELTSTPSI